jgi:exonuclease 3'-5' domain-containing protein 1
VVIAISVYAFCNSIAIRLPHAINDSPYNQREARNIQHLSVYWDAQGPWGTPPWNIEDPLHLPLHIGLGKDVVIVRGLAQLEVKESVEIGGFYAKHWPRYLQEKMGLEPVNKQNIPGSFWERSLRDYQDGTEGLNPWVDEAPDLTRFTLLPTLVSDTTTLSKYLDEVFEVLDVPIGEPPPLYLDLEGIKLSRNGRVSLLTLHINHHYTSITLILDINTLRGEAFTTPSAKSPNTNLKCILESSKITKIFFDVRNDSDALFSHFGITLKGVYDIQLMENASRPAYASKRLLNGLKKCIEHDAPLSRLEKQTWSTVKAKGEKLWNPEKGGSYKVFDARPLSEDVFQYCVQDVLLLPKLRSVYWGKLSEEWKKKVEAESMDRVRESQRPTYDPQGLNRALGPWQAAEVKTAKLSLDDWLPYEDEDLGYDFEDDWLNDDDICAAEETWDGYISG